MKLGVSNARPVLGQLARLSESVLAEFCFGKEKFARLALCVCEWMA